MKQRKARPVDRKWVQQKSELHQFITRWRSFKKRFLSPLCASLSVTTQRQWSATALTPKLQNIFSLSAITSPFSPLLADSLISHLKQRGQKYNIINLLPLPRARCLITIRRYGNRLAEWVITVISIWGAWRRAHLGDGEVHVCMEMGLDVLCGYISMNRVCRHLSLM